MARMQKPRTLVSVALIVVLVATIAVVGLYFGPAARAARGSDAAESVLLAFGGKLKSVSLLTPTTTRATAIEENYGPFITPELLADWKANPAHAPGTLSASAVPDRLGIGSITSQGKSRVITGEVVLVSSGASTDESVDTVPFVALLTPTSDGWKIAAYSEEKVQTLKNIPTTDEDIPGAK